MAEDIMKEVLDAITKRAEPNVLVVLLATELKEVRKQVAALRLLVEHEETVRSKKLHRETPTKQSFLRGSKLHERDRVYCSSQDNRGTVLKVDGSRIQIQFDGGLRLWRKLADVHRVENVA